MTAQSPTAWLLSLALHAFVALVIAFLAYTASVESQKHPPILELVAGEGDNFMATEAPALGETGGVTVVVPKVVETPPAPAPAAPPEIAPVVPAPPPIAPAPQAAAPAPTPTKAPDAVPDFSKQIRWQIIRGESTGKLRAKREREAELKKQAAEKKRLADEAKKMTKAEFDTRNKSKSTAVASKNAPVKVAKIDAKGIAKGVVGGSTANTKGGASGKALEEKQGLSISVTDREVEQRDVARGRLARADDVAGVAQIARALQC